MKNTVMSLVCGLTFSGLSACGPDMGKVDASDEKAAKDGDTGTSEELVEVQVQVSEADQGGGFALAGSAAKFQIKLEGCASGYQSTATELSTQPLQAYKFDKGCLAKLESFEVNGISYIPGAQVFTTWLANDSATFVDTLDANNKLKVLVVSQLANPISATEAVEYSFAEIAAGADAAVTGVGASHAILVGGQAAPDFKASKLDYVGMTAAGAGQFVFSLECKSVAVIGTGADAACKDVKLGNVKYRLVEDTYGGTLTTAQADLLFAGTPPGVDAATDLIDVGDATSPNGGFATKSDASVLVGPDQIHLKPNMLLVLQAGPSYQYFNIDVTTLTQN